MNKKILVLLLSGLSTLLVVVIFVSNSIDISGYYLGRGEPHNALIFFPFIFFFSLLTFWLPSTYFTTWWQFARIAIPVILPLVILINLNWHHTPGGWFNTSNILDVPALFLLYTLFTIGSAFTVWRAYRHRQITIR